jgi:serine/threonine protein kinase
MSEERSPVDDSVWFGVPFGDLAVAKGFATPEQVRQCLDLQAELSQQGNQVRLGDLMVERGHLLPHQLEAVLQEQQKAPGHKLVKDYEILSRIGEGGMGYVLQGRRQKDGLIVALKVLFPRLAADQQYIERFRREARIGLTLEHSSLVKCLEVGEADDLHYMVLEYVDGKDLGQILQDRGYVPEAQTLAILLSVARGMAYAHSKGLVHRDMKPANIMLTKKGEVKVMDFGLARQTAGPDRMSLTMSGVLMGTPHYISPEQVEGEEGLDHRSDIYSLGITVFHMLTGRPPFIGGNLYEVLNDHVTQRVPDPRVYNKSISPETASLVMWMCTREKDKRMPTMDRLVQEVGRQLGLPSAVPADPVPFRLEPLSHRPRTTQAMFANLRHELRCPRCHVEFRGDPVLLTKGQRLRCDGCGLVFPCPVDPPTPPPILPDEIQVEQEKQDDSSPVMIPVPRRPTSGTGMQVAGAGMMPAAYVPAGDPQPEALDDDMKDTGTAHVAVQAPVVKLAATSDVKRWLHAIFWLACAAAIAAMTVYICEYIFSGNTDAIFK